MLSSVEIVLLIFAEFPSLPCFYHTCAAKFNVLNLNLTNETLNIVATN